MSDRLKVICGDVLAGLRQLPDESVHMCCTSPPYWGLRDYGIPGQLGLEKTPEKYVAKMVEVFRGLWRVLRKDGTCWVNLGDSYVASPTGNFGTKSKLNGIESPTYRETISKGHETRRGNLGIGLPAKNLCGIPWRVAFALQADGWWLRQDIIWHKPNPMPESVTDRCTKAHEYIFLLSKSARYFFDAEAIKEASITNDERRPYGSMGAWELDGRPAEQRHGGKPRNGANSLRGQGANRITPSGPANRDGRNMAEVGVGALRNKRSVWTVPSAPYAEAHFATYPPDLIKPCIFAGTSARGCCPKCGAPWERVVEDTPEYAQFKANEKQRKGGSMRSSELQTDGLTRGSSNKSVTAETKTTGWQPTCECGEAKTEPCTVLDPFAGSGTTGQVALELGRRAILIELNPEYVKLIEQRCNVTPGLAL